MLEQGFEIMGVFSMQKGVPRETINDFDVHSIGALTLAYLSPPALIGQTSCGSINGRLRRDGRSHTRSPGHGGPTPVPA